jgi:predicted acetyltransferase
MKVTSAKPSEYEQIQRFLEDVYGHATNAFREGWPQVWQKDYTVFKNTLVIREKKQIVSLVRVIPLSLVQDGVKIESAGIGGVSTLYSHRGKGYMSEILSEAFCEMRKQKYPLSVLWGDRHRYGYFGYENCGATVVLKINARGLHKTGVKPADARRFFEDKQVLKKIMDAYNANSYRRQRQEKEFIALYKRRGAVVYYALQDKEFAYLVAPSTESSGRGEIKEYGGNAGLLLGILKHLQERFSVSEFSLCCPGLNTVPDAVLEASSGWSVKSTCMLKIIDLKETLRSFSMHPDFFFPEGEEITLTVKGGDSATLVKKRDRLSIQNRTGKNEIILSEAGMARLLFGTSFWAPANTDAKMLHLLKMFLPLKFFIWQMDYI